MLAPEKLQKLAEVDGFRQWFGRSKITTSEGLPLIAFHGTTGAFDEFQSMVPVDVVRLDGHEIVCANSWDMGDDALGCPEGFHYQALSNARILGAREALSRELRQAHSPLGLSADTRRVIRDLKRLARGTLEVRTEPRPSGGGFYFTTDINYAFVRDIGAREGGNVMPVFLRIENPVYLSAAEIESAGAAFRIDAYRSKGHDGAIFAEHPGDLTRRGWGGSPQIVAFDPSQIKSALGNRGSYRRELRSITR